MIVQPEVFDLSLLVRDRLGKECRARGSLPMREQDKSPALSPMYKGKWKALGLVRAGKDGFGMSRGKEDARSR